MHTVCVSLGYVGCERFTRSECDLVNLEPIVCTNLRIMNRIYVSLDLIKGTTSSSHEVNPISVSLDRLMCITSRSHEANLISVSLDRVVCTTIRLRSVNPICDDLDSIECAPPYVHNH